MIFFNPSLGDDFIYRQKRSGHVLSKMRLMTAQMEAYLADGLWVNIGATQLISRLRIPDWAPRSSWRFGFGARTGNAWGEHDFHSVDNIDIRLGRLAASRGSVRVELGLRGEWGLIAATHPTGRRLQRVSG